MKRFKILKTLLFFCFLLIGKTLLGQQILLDKPVRAGELTLFPELNNETVYYYLPDKVRLGKHPDGKPMFSFLRYVETVRSATESREGDGGGIVHAVIELKVPDEMLNKARQEVRRIKPNAIIQGPIVYKGGTIALISSFAEAGGAFTKKVIGLGKAPILDNEKAAISVLLTKQGAKILWESFKTPTPDMSISFEMEVAGFRSPIGATIEANFDQIYQHQSFQAAISSPMLAGEINQSFDDLVKTGAIKVTQVGSDANIERAVEAAYTKLTNMMFDPAGGSGSPNLGQLTSTLGGGQTSLLDRATTMLNTARQEARQDNERRRGEAMEELRNSEQIARRNTPPTPTNGGASVAADTANTMMFGSNSGVRSVPNDEMSRVENIYNRRRALIEQTQVAVPSLAVAFSYEMKRIHQQGTFRIDLNKYNNDNLVMRFDENFGQINCETCFRSVSPDDFFAQREVSAFLDGANSVDFDKYINFVNISMRKKHQQGEVTLDEVRIDKKNLNGEGNNFKMVYGRKGDDNSIKWSEYEYKTDWFFFGGYKATAEWAKSTTSTIPLTAPFVRRVISVEADPDVIKKENIRAIEVKVYTKFGDYQQAKELRLNPRSNQLSGQIEVIQAKDTFDYEYEFTWFLSDGTTKTSGRKNTTSTLLFVDTL